ncbi:MAG TPA: thiamine pyrophosphate-dependent enzyme [Mycobacteriales bacterium]|nr:thiamine pyrophosphate-dependent enzyme [Mycobacteriales bacterium]
MAELRQERRHELRRADVLRDIDRAFADSPIVLTLGGTAREMLAVAGRRPNHLVNLDAMGQTVPVALGLALGLGRDGDGGRRTVAVEGDGSLLMGFSVLTTVGHLRPANLVVIVLDNGVYLATGGQPTAAAGVDLCAVADACGWAGSRDVDGAGPLADALAWAAREPGPLLLRVRVGTGQVPTDFFLADPVVLASDFRRWLARAEPTPGQGSPHAPGSPVGS